jgi:uncharacterized protein YkwD
MASTPSRRPARVVSAALLSLALLIAGLVVAGAGFSEPTTAGSFASAAVPLPTGHLTAPHLAQATRAAEPGQHNLDTPAAVDFQMLAAVTDQQLTAEKQRTKVDTEETKAKARSKWRLNRTKRELRREDRIAQRQTATAEVSTAAPAGSAPLSAPANAPEGAPDTSGVPQNSPSSAAPDIVASTAPATLQPPPPSTSPSPQAVEAEFFQLVNALRANPGGELRRPTSLPSCVHDPVFGISVDATGTAVNAAPALLLDAAVSDNIARAWSTTMNASGTLEHRPGTQVDDLFSYLGRTTTIRGENVSVVGGSDPAHVAWVHFENLRDSATGHYCNLVSPAFTHVGVGAHQGADRHWLTQNFFAVG